ncbi:MAG: LacI family DNA-binding transcriptional regulator [Pseudomonadota bacterium]
MVLNKRVTLKDIARATGVHVSTVSRALDPNRQKTLTEDVVEKIRATAAELGYRPNRVAYSLRTNKTMTIGVMIPDITNMIFPPIVRGIESVMEPSGYAAIIVNTDSQRGREAELLEILRDRGVDGIIHTAALLSEPSIVDAAQKGLPVVTLNRRNDDASIPFVINDDAAGVRAVFEHLRSNGHEAIAHLAGPSDLSTGQLRCRAFVDVARDHGASSADLTISEAQRFDEEEGLRCTFHILDTAPDTTAILCANDRLALGALQALRDRGLDCPRDVSVTGFNDMPFLDMIPPGLTTVRIQQFEAGRIAAEHLLAMLCGNTALVPHETILPVALVERASVAAPRAL